MIERYLKDLDISRKYACKLFSVNSRTLRRWIENSDELPMPIIQAFEAWIKLKQLGESWDPNEVKIPTDLRNSFRIKIHNKQIKSNLPWELDLEKNQIKLAAIHITFCIRIDNLGRKEFYPKFLYRTDKKPDWRRDTDLILDACAFLNSHLQSINDDGSD